MRKKKKKPRTPLTVVVAAAEAEGLSYGKYVVKHESAAHERPRKVRKGQIMSSPSKPKSSCYECPECDRNNCFAYSNGECVILTDNDFGARECPFYKTQAQFERERDAADSTRR